MCQNDKKLFLWEDSGNYSDLGLTVSREITGMNIWQEIYLWPQTITHNIECSCHKTFQGIYIYMYLFCPIQIVDTGYHHIDLMLEYDIKVAEGISF